MSGASLTTLATSLQNHFAGLSPIIAIVASLLALIALIYATLLERRIAKVMQGRSGSLEETILVLNREMREMHEFRGEVEKYLKLVETRLRGSVSGIGMVRFNPFSEGQGGNQSFAVAMLDEEGTGVVLSTLYARNHLGVYAKPIERGVSSYELSDEEKKVINDAREAVAKRKKL